MPSFCAVNGCSDKYASSSQISFHKYPIKRPELLQKWIEFTNRGPSWQPSKWSSVCSKHFVASDFNYIGIRKSLKKTSVPSVKEEPERASVLSNPATRSETVLTPIVEKEEVVYSSNAPTIIPMQAAGAGKKQIRINGKPRDPKTREALGHGPKGGKDLSGHKAMSRVEEHDSSSESRISESGDEADMEEEEDDDVNNEDEDDDEDSETDCHTQRDRQQSQPPCHSSPGRHGAARVHATCRLCNSVTFTYVPFSANFEVYGMIQKCFPTLNIQQSDHLPKDVCSSCLKLLEQFAQFVDRVLETQKAIMQKTTPTARNVERSLKIKQEPVVRVKQEVQDEFERILDMLDDSYDPEQEHSGQMVSVHKMDFSDMNLNPQEILNNCDIMEIINLDDPFIDIPDDDGGENSSSTSPRLSRQVSPDKYRLSEEHNYASLHALELKQEQQACNYNSRRSSLKTEKLDRDVPEDILEEAVEPDDVPQVGCTIEYGNEAHSTETQLESCVRHTELNDTSSLQRSNRPIVTSVTAVEAKLEFHTTPTGLIMNHHPAQRPSIPSSTPFNMSVGPTSTKPHNKPNIVVLNDSVVQSSSAFGWHDCALCSQKFLSVESLGQHYATTHGQQPTRLSVPVSKSPPEVESQAQHVELSYTEICKLEESSQESSDRGEAHEANDQCDSHNSSNLWNIFQTTDVAQAHNEVNTAYSCALSSSARNRINILDMQQSFISPPPLQQQQQQITQVHVPGAQNSEQESPEQYNMLDIQQGRLRDFSTSTESLHHLAQGPISMHNLIPHMEERQAQSTNGYYTGDASELTTINNPIWANEPMSMTEEEQMTDVAVANYVGEVDLEEEGNLATTTTNEMPTISDSTQEKTNKTKTQILYDNISREYLDLQSRYLELKKMCQSLMKDEAIGEGEEGMQARANKIKSHKPRKGKKCGKCFKRFMNIFQLLKHKQRKRHFVAKPRTAFRGFCIGCSKFFRHPRALANHQDYICPTLSLERSWLALKPWARRRPKLQQFKCTCCRRITFTHWRLFKHHELQCRSKKLSKFIRKKEMRKMGSLSPLPEAFKRRTEKIGNHTRKGYRLSGIHHKELRQKPPNRDCFRACGISKGNASRNKHKATMLPKWVKGSSSRRSNQKYGHRNVKTKSRHNNTSEYSQDEEEVLEQIYKTKKFRKAQTRQALAACTKSRYTSNTRAMLDYDSAASTSTSPDSSCSYASFECEDTNRNHGEFSSPAPYSRQYQSLSHRSAGRHDYHFNTEKEHHLCRQRVLPYVVLAGGSRRSSARAASTAKRTQQRIIVTAETARLSSLMEACDSSDDSS